MQKSMEIKERTCIICGKSFVPYTSSQVYCSPACSTLGGDRSERENRRYQAALAETADTRIKHFIGDEAYQAALQDDFHTFIEYRGQAILNAINNVCRVNDGLQTMNSNLDESEQEILLDGTIEDDVDTTEEATRSRKANFTFEMVGIPEGASLVFIPTGVEVTVNAGNQVEYQGKSYSLSAFAAEFMPDDLRTPSGAYQGPKFFSYNGQGLIELRNEIEGQLL